MMVLFILNLWKIQNIFEDFYSDLAGKLVRKLPVALTNLNNNLTKQYYMNIEKSCHKFKLCNATFKNIKKILACLDSSKASCLDWLFSIFCTNPRNWSVKVCKFDRHKIWWSCFCSVLERIHSVFSVTFSFTWKVNFQLHSVLPSNTLTPFLRQSWLYLKKGDFFWETCWCIYVIST